jgi:hypothetical protein
VAWRHRVWHWGLRAAISQAGHTAVIKPPPLKPAVDDFTADEAADTVTCPAGITRRITARRRVTFGAACTGCPLRARCTTARHGRKLELHPYDAILRAARAARAAQPALREDYQKHRPHVERVISQVATRGGRPEPARVRYRPPMPSSPSRRPFDHAGIIRWLTPADQDNRPEAGITRTSA